jgi:hypothetical protein
MHQAQIDRLFRQAGMSKAHIAQVKEEADELVRQSENDEIIKRIVAKRAANPTLSTAEEKPFTFLQRWPGIIEMVVLWTLFLVGFIAICSAEPFDPYRHAEQRALIDQEKRWQGQQAERDSLRRFNEDLERQRRDSERPSRPSWVDPNPQFGVHGRDGSYRTCQEGFGQVYCR